MEFTPCFLVMLALLAERIERIGHVGQHEKIRGLVQFPCQLWPGAGNTGIRGPRTQTAPLHHELLPKHEHVPLPIPGNMFILLSICPDLGRYDL